MLRSLLTFAVAVLLIVTIGRSADLAGPETRPIAVPLGNNELIPALARTSVSLPFDDLRTLIETGGPPAEHPPVDFAFSPANYTATVSDKTVSVSGSVDVTVLVDTWALAPIGPSASGISSATVDGRPAPLVVRGDSIFVLLKGKGEKKIAVSLSRDLTADAGITRFDLPLIPAPLVNLTVAIPQTGLSVRAAGGSMVSSSEDAKATTLKGTFPGGSIASINWRPAPVAGAAEPRTYVQAETLAIVEKGLVRVTTRLGIEVARAPLKELKINIDPALTVLSIGGQDIAGWKESPANPPAAGGKTIAVTFAGDADGDRAIDIVAERDVPDVGGDLSLRPPAVEGARRDRGYLAIATDGTFDVRPGKSAANRVSVGDLPGPLRSPGPAGTPSAQIAYRYDEPGPISLTLEPARAQAPQLTVTTLTRVTVERGSLRCSAEMDYEISHAGVDTLRVALPDGIEIGSVTGAGIRDTQTIADAKQRTLVVGMKDLARGTYKLAIDYVVRFDDAEDSAPEVPLLTHPGASQDRGFIGVEVRDSVEVVPTSAGFDRIDVKELPEPLWSAARSPLLFGYRYQAPAGKLTLALTRHADLDVLVAMSDVCEAATTWTPDGKSMTKMMFITRNNLKQYMTLKMPEGAPIWSAFVDDHPVTPARNAGGDVLIPLKKSEAEDADDDDAEGGKSYRARRERRRGESADGAVAKQARVMRERPRTLEDDAPPDLKPYDVEIVFVTPAIKFGDHGPVHAALPRSDVPIGQLSWAIFLPESMRVVDTNGNVKEVSRFTLPFPHFGDVAYERNHKLADGKALEAAQQQLQQEAAQAMAGKLAERAKAPGVLPVRIEIPMIGEIHRFEKLLTVDESPEVSLTYSRKAE